MAVKIRLRQQGCTNGQTYRLVACDERSPRGGRYLEKLGWSNPLAKGSSAKAHVEGARVAYWLEQGASMTETAKNLIARESPEVFSQWSDRQKNRRAKVIAKRKTRQQKRRANRGT